MKNPKKIQDPTEAALSAIQEALTLELDNAQSAAEAPPAHAERPIAVNERPAERPLPTAGRPIARRAPRLDDQRPEERGEARQEPRPEGRREGAPRSRLEMNERRAANDDRQTIGNLLGQLKRRPPVAPYWWAAGAAVLWLGIGIALALTYHRALMASSEGVQSLANSPALLGVFASILLPPLAFFGMASVMRRSQELQGIARSMTEVALRLAQPEAIATESVVTVGQAVRREVAAMGDGIDRAITRAGELETMVRAEVSILERAYEENEVRIRALVDELQAERHNIQIETDRLREGIAGAEAVLSDEVKEVAARIHATMLEASERVTDILGQKGEHITAALARVGDSMIDSLTSKGGELIDRLQLTGSEIRQDLSDSGELLVQTLKSRTDDLASNLLSTTSDVAVLIDRWGDDVNINIDRLKQGIGDALGESSGRLSDEINARVTDASEAFRVAGDAVIANFTAQGGELVRKLEESGGAAAETLESRGAELAERIEATSTRIHDAIVLRGDSLPQRISEAGDRIATALDRSGSQLTSTLGEKGNEISSSLANAGSDITERLSLVATEVTKAIGVRGSKVNDSFRETADMLITTIGSKGDAIKDMLNSRLKVVEETITVRGGELADRLHHDGTTLARAMHEGVKAFETTVKVHAPELMDQINHRVAAVNENLRVSVATLDERLATTTSTVASTMDQRIARIEQTLDQRAQSLTETLASRTVTFARTISDGTKGATEALDKSVETLETFFNSRSKVLGDVLMERAEVVHRALGSRAQEIATVLDGRVTRIEELVLGRLEGVATALEARGAAMADTLVHRVEGVSGQLKSNAADVERSLTDLSLNVGQSLTSHAEKVADALGTRLNEIAHLIDDKNGSFLLALERTSQRAVAEITATNTALKGDVQAIIERLGDANSTFQSAMTSAVSNLGDFSGTFSRQVDGFNTTVASIGQAVDSTALRFDGQIKTLRELAGGALSEIAGLTERFEQQSRFLGEATQALGATHERVDATLTARRAAIEELAAALTHRVADMDGRLQNFHAMLEDTFKSAQNRARQIAGVVAEATSGSTKSIESQFELVRQAADAERERTAAAMRQTYDAALKDVQRLFGETGSQFTEVAKELKRTTEEVQRAIELAREEMKRGILELPAETEASAATMRRAVAEQIKALAELNEIVARQGQALDVVEAGARTTVQDIARSSVSREAARPRAEAAEPRRPATPPRRIEPAAERTQERPTERPTERPSERPMAPPRPAPRPSAEQEAGEGRDSWLSELLARASDDLEGSPAPAAQRPQPAPRPAPAPAAAEPAQSLDNLSADIARMVDQQALADCWERHKRGERGVFTRRIYTLQGQQTFDALRRRYRADAEFHDTVDRYVTEFDRLLEQVAADERGAQLTRTYLTSDTGKVYTMLAHASGRLD